MRIASVIVGLLISCSRPPESGGTKAATPTAAPAPSTELSLAPSTGLSLFGRLELEARQRDKADPSTTRVLAALSAAGLTLSEVRQQSGAAMGASYCLMLNASHHVTLSVCEFPDPQSASAGAQVSRKALRQIAGRTVHVKRSTTLSVIGSETNEASEVIRKRARAAFEAL